jgi:hypothetical protein
MSPVSVGRPLRHRSISPEPEHLNECLFRVNRTFHSHNAASRARSQCATGCNPRPGQRFYRDCTEGLARKIGRPHCPAPCSDGQVTGTLHRCRIRNYQQAPVLNFIDGARVALSCSHWGCLAPRTNLLREKPTYEIRAKARSDGCGFRAAICFQRQLRLRPGTTSSLSSRSD